MNRIITMDIMMGIMKNIGKTVCGLCAILLSVFSMAGCNDDYAIDGGVSNPYFDGNVMQYLESRPDLFEDLVKVIKMTKWNDILSNEEVTFFAPTDFSIDRSVDYMNDYLYNYDGKEKVTDLSQVDKSVWEDIIGMYVMQGKYRLNDIAQIDTAAISTYPGQTNFTYDKSYKMTMGVCYGEANGIKYAGYRQIMYAYSGYGYPLYAYVASCNIEPDNGIVHVIRLDHRLGFSPSVLYQKAVQAGITYPSAKRAAVWKKEKEYEKHILNAKNDE